MAELEVRPATSEALRAFWGHSKPQTVKAIMAFLDDEPVGVLGVSYDRGQLVAFSEIRDELRPYKWFIYKTAWRFLQSVKRQGLPIRAVVNRNERNAARLLEQLGFVYLDTTNDGEVYACPIQ